MREEAEEFNGSISGVGIEPDTALVAGPEVPDMPPAGKLDEVPRKDLAGDDRTSIGGYRVTVRAVSPLGNSRMDRSGSSARP